MTWDVFYIIKTMLQVRLGLGTFVRWNYNSLNQNSRYVNEILLQMFVSDELCDMWDF